MAVISESFTIETRGNTDILDITQKVAEKVRNSGISIGTATVFIAGSTAGVTSIEYEPELIADFRAALEKLAPGNARYHHPSNAFAHIRSSLVGPSFTVPVIGQRLRLGTWQQVVLMDFDNRPRTREVIIQIIGE